MLKLTAVGVVEKEDNNLVARNHDLVARNHDPADEIYGTKNSFCDYMKNILNMRSSLSPFGPFNT
jgi:hypothetical protein